MPDLATRRRYVDWGIRFTQDTPLAPSLYEQELLERYVAGQLSLDSAVYLSSRHRATHLRRPQLEPKEPHGDG